MARALHLHLELIESAEGAHVGASNGLQEVSSGGGGRRRRMEVGLAPAAMQIVVAGRVVLRKGPQGAHFGALALALAFGRLQVDGLVARFIINSFALNRRRTQQLQI